MKTRISFHALIATVALLMAGCETMPVTARIDEKAAVFAGLTAAQQADIKAGTIEVGYTSDMVYMALGQPARSVTRETPDGLVEMWTYRNFYAPPAFGVAADAAQQYRAEKYPGRAVEHPTGSQKSIADTRGGPQTNLYLPELVSNTLYVQFFNNRVFQIKLGGEN